MPIAMTALSEAQAGVPPRAPRLGVGLTWLRPLGQGALAQVDLVRLEGPLGGVPAGRQLASKRLHARWKDDPRAQAALAAEAEIGARVKAPSLVDVLGLYEDDQGLVLLESYVPGRSLDQLLAERGPLPEPLLRRAGQQIAGALRALHGAGFVHGDLKLENVRLDDQERATLLDLGLARHQDSNQLPQAGSLPFLSPERLAGGGPTTSSDQFALGVLLYQLATGRHPFSERLGQAALEARDDPSDGGEVEAALELQGRAEFVPPSRHVPQLSPLFDALCGALLDSRPAARPSADSAHGILSEGEAGSWWRARVEEALSRGSSDLWLRRGGFALPLCGRESELERLAALWAEVSADRPRGAAVLLSGPSGAGKSHLAQAFVEGLRQGQRPPMALFARLSDFSETQPYGSGLELLRRFLLLPEGSAPTEREQRLVRSRVAPIEAEALLSALDPESTRTIEGSVSLALARFFAGEAQRFPLVLVLEDVHHARSATLGALARFAQAFAGVPALLLLTLDPEADPARPAELAQLVERLTHPEGPVRPLVRIELPPLGPEAVQDLVQRSFHHGVPRLRLARVLWERSRGNPGLISELIEGLFERGEAHSDGGDPPRFRLSIAPEDLPLPGSLSTSIRERLARLGPDSRRWLERFAVVGGRLEPEFLMRTFPPCERTEIDAVLTELVRRGWLEAAGTRFRFTRPALRDAIYRGIPEERRLRLHRMAAARLAQEGLPERSPEAAYQRAFHLRAAHEASELLTLIRPLIEVVARRASPARVLRLARWGLEALGELPPRARALDLELYLLEVGTDAADRVGDRRMERRLLDRLAEREIDPEQEPESAARAALLHARFADLRGNLSLAEHLLERAAKLGVDHGLPAIESEACRRLGRVLFNSGRFEGANVLLERSHRVAASARQRAKALFVRAQGHVLSDRLEDALADLDAGHAELRRDPSQPYGDLLAAAWLVRARALRSIGRPRRALAAAKRALEWTRRSGERRFEAEALARVGALSLEANLVEEAEAHLREARLLAAELEDGRSRCLAEIGLAVLLAERPGEDVRSVLTSALEHAREANFRRGEAVAHALLARLDLERAQLELALRHSDEAMRLLEVYGAELFDHLVIAGTRCSVLRAADRTSEARALEKALAKHLQRINGALAEPALRSSQRRYADELLELVISGGANLTPRRSEE
jgi:tetratricopeptide (TPR) repeat protein